MFEFTAALVCDPGRFRSNNQDNYIFDGRTLPSENRGVDGVLFTTANDTKPFLAGVFDGMGGYSYGERAAYLAAEAFRQNGVSAFENSNVPAFYDRLSAIICAEAERLRVSEIGTTAAVVMIRNGTLHLSNIGDSRIYVYRNRRLFRLSEEHTNWKMLEDLGIRNRKPELTQYLGMTREICIAPYISQTGLLAGDAILLCTDGLNEQLDDLFLLRVLRDVMDPRTALKLLRDEARGRGARDNLTAIIIQSNPHRKTGERKHEHRVSETV